MKHSPIPEGQARPHAPEGMSRERSIELANEAYYYHVPVYHAIRYTSAGRPSSRASMIASTADSLSTLPYHQFSG